MRDGRVRELSREFLGDRSLGLLDEPSDFLSVSGLDDDRRDEIDPVRLHLRSLLPVRSLRDRELIDPVVGNAGGVERGGERRQLPLTVATPVAAPHLESVVVGRERVDHCLVEPLDVRVAGRERFERHGG